MTEGVALPKPEPQQPEPEPQAADDGVAGVAVPATFHFPSGRQFIVDEVNGWGYTEGGIFAKGHIKGRTGEIHVLIPGEIEYIELHYDRLKKHLQDLANEGVNDASSSEDV